MQWWWVLKASVVIEFEGAKWWSRMMPMTDGV